ncbi:MAG: phosphoglycerate kinase [bacterium]
MQSIKNLNLKNKRVLLRMDFNGLWRIKASLKTINFLLKKGAKVTVIGHYKRPAKPDKKYSLMQFRKYLPKNIILLENLRFDPREETNNLNFAKELASKANIFVQDAFSVCHREHASVIAITKYLPSCAGLALEQEIKALNKKFAKPICYIIGGAKLETKLPLAKILLEKCEHLILGGLIANAVLANHKIELTSTKLHLPVDAVTKTKTCAVGTISPWQILDIGTDSIKLFISIINTVKTIIWNGPMGKFENKKYQQGTLGIAKSVANSKAYSIIGGGETIFALEKLNLLDKINHVSTGGGALLEYLAMGTLPGIEALR